MLLRTSGAGNPHGGLCEEGGLQWRHGGPTRARSRKRRIEPRNTYSPLRPPLLGASREMTGCYQMALRDIATLRMTPGVEAVAADHLDDPDPQVVISAVETLGRYGS